MPTSVLEIVELSDGRIVLRQVDGNESLVTLEFSKETKSFLQGMHLEVARAMFNVGVQLVSKLADNDFNHDEDIPILH